MQGQGDKPGRRVVRIDEERARKFMRNLSDHPFLAVVWADDTVYIYTKDNAPEMDDVVACVKEAIG